jgi:formylglycine-generating enzyme required for sulfatase activity
VLALRQEAETKLRPGDKETVDLGGGVKLELVWCPAGSFIMGSPTNEEDCRWGEMQHRVTLTKGFWLGKTEVTQWQWVSVMGSNPSNFNGTDLPVETAYRLTPAHATPTRSPMKPPKRKHLRGST